MAIQRVLAFISGRYQEYVAKDVSAGVADAGNLVALSSTGLLDVTLLPSGLGATTAILPATEALAAGALVNVWSSSGTPSVRNADGSTAGKPCHGFVLTAVANAGNATIYFTGVNTAMSGLTAGPVYLGSTPGATAAAGQTAAGSTYQQVGIATGPTTLDFQPMIAVVRA